MVSFVGAGPGHIDLITVKGRKLLEEADAVVYKATWEDEKIIRGTLRDIKEKVEEEGIIKTAIILVGDFIKGEYERSKLYDPSYSHEYREARR